MGKLSCLHRCHGSVQSPSMVLTFTCGQQFTRNPSLHLYMANYCTMLKVHNMVRTPCRSTMAANSWRFSTCFIDTTCRQHQRRATSSDQDLDSGNAHGTNVHLLVLCAGRCRSLRDAHGLDKAGDDQLSESHCTEYGQQNAANRPSGGTTFARPE